MQVTFVELAASDISVDEILLVDEYLNRLSAIDARMGRVVELKVFAGLTYPEIAAVLNVSSATVRADMRFGLAWLRKEIEHSPSD
jgi:DNA-directed RNA polymerase specialized sigma24 family protein